MEFILYENQSDSNVINKKLTGRKTVDITLKKQNNLMDLIIKLQTDINIIKYNYCYIPDFKRYYFIQDIEVYNKNMYNLYLHIDLLETYKKELQECNCIIGRSQQVNKFYGTKPTLENFIVDKYESDTTPEIKNNMILVTMGV